MLFRSMEQQLLYERWAVKDTWRLRDEALPLLFGINPDVYKKNSEDVAGKEDIKSLWLHARQCVEHNLLQIKDRGQDADDWQVEPLDIYQWAVVSRLSVPEPFGAIMEFIARTVKKSPPPVTPEEIPDGRHISSAFDADREKVLGLALAALAAYPARCRDGAGEVTAERILETLLTLSCLQEQSLKLAHGAMLDIIGKWLQVTPQDTSSR